jgi:hypothetical protein
MMEIARHGAVRRRTKWCVRKQNCTLEYSIPSIDDVIVRFRVEPAFRKSPTAVFLNMARPATCLGTK